MKHAIIYLLILLYSLTELFASAPPFYIERLNCDFNGVIADENVIICYGDHGIMTWSRDKGKTWGQLNIGDKHDIYKIENIDGVFYGVTSYSIIISTDGGKRWQNKEIVSGPDIKAMTVNAGKMYILTRSSLLSCEIGPDPEPAILAGLDTLSEYHQIAADDEFIYINANNDRILKFEKNGALAANIEIDYDHLCYACSKFYLKTIDNELYIFLKSKDQINSSKLWKSSDDGGTWSKVGKVNISTTAYYMQNGEVFFISPISDSNLFSHNFSKITESGDIEKLNAPDPIRRCIYYNITVEYSDIVEISDNLLIAVGKDKLISISRDGGTSWDLISYFNSYYTRTPFCFDNNFIYINDKIIYCVNGYGEQFYNTTNGGATWLPQKYFEFGYPREASNFYFQDSGDGFLKYLMSSSDSNSVSVRENGNIMEFNDKDSFFNYQDNIYDFDYYKINRNGIRMGDTVLFFFSECHTGQSCNGFLARYDEEGNFIDSAQFCDLMLKNVVAANDSVVFVLGYQMSGLNRYKTPDDSSDFSYFYRFLKSSDRGATWDSVVSHPFHMKFGLTYNKAFYEYQIMLNSQPIVYGNEIYYLTKDSLIYIYDYVSDSFDSVKVCPDMSGFDNYYFKFNNRNFVISDRDAIYFADDIRCKADDWDSLEAASLFSGWETNSNHTDAITSPLIINDTTGFLCIGRLESLGAYMKGYKLNLVKLHAQDPNKVEEPTTEVFNYYKWMSPPWPMPARGIVRTNFYWDSKSKLEDADFSVWDIYGRRIEKEIKVERISDFGAELSVDFSDMQAGVYFISISLFGESIAVPVVIMR